jgi:hypothetical protein
LPTSSVQYNEVPSSDFYKFLLKTLQKKIYTLISIFKHQQMHLRIIKIFIYIPRNAPTCFGSVVQSSVSSKFVAKITHNYGIKFEESKLIKIDKTD